MRYSDECCSSRKSKKTLCMGGKVEYRGCSPRCMAFSAVAKLRFYPGHNDDVVATGYRAHVFYFLTLCCRCISKGKGKRIASLGLSRRHGCNRGISSLTNNIRSFLKIFWISKRRRSDCISHNHRIGLFLF